MPQEAHEPQSQIASPPEEARDTLPQPRAATCGACGSPLDADDRFCPACGKEHLDLKEQGPLDERHFSCGQCGAQVHTPMEVRSFVCPFCDSANVVELDERITGRQTPEFVLPFSITLEQAQTTFHDWLKDNGWFRPGDLSSAQVAEKMKGVYVPFWTFSMLAESAWSARIGEYWYRTETYTTRDAKGRTVVRTRRKRMTEWWPLSGRHHRFHSGYLVSGSQGLPQDWAERIKPFRLPALQRYAPRFLAGWLSEEYSVESQEALEICKKVFEQQEQHHVASFMPGDTHQGLSVQTSFSHINADLVLLPVYLLTYRYKDRLFRFLVNGQTGRTAGEKPVSGKRIALLVALGVGALAALLILLALLGAL